MAVLRANYVPVDAAGAWRGRIGAAMRYYAHRPGADKDHQERERTAERAALGETTGGGRHAPHQDEESRGPGEARVRGRWFITADGEKIPLREAQDRFLADVEHRRDQARRGREERAAERRAARTARSETRLRSFVAGARDEHERSRREELAARWRHAREARERLPDPVFRVYRVVLSTSWAVLDGRDIEHVLGTALGGAVGAVAGSVAHAGVSAYRGVRRAQERHARAAQRASERQARHEQAAERRRLEREQQAKERRQARADARFAARFLYVRHEGPGHSHPHVHALFVTDHRGLDTRDLDRMRAALSEREALREREQAQTRQQQAHQEHEHRRAHTAAQEMGR